MVTNHADFGGSGSGHCPLLIWMKCAICKRYISDDAAMFISDVNMLRRIIASPAR